MMKKGIMSQQTCYMPLATWGAFDHAPQVRACNYYQEYIIKREGECPTLVQYIPCTAVVRKVNDIHNVLYFHSFTLHNFQLHGMQMLRDYGFPQLHHTL